jgi:hypothetical protein
VPCACGDWEFRDVSITTDIAAFERWCPRCRSKVLLVFRKAAHLATVRLESAHPREIRLSLEQAGLAGSELSLLMQIAREMVS